MSNHHALALATVGYICPDDEIELVGTVSPSIVAAETINPQIVPKPIVPPSIICEDPSQPVPTLTGPVGVGTVSPSIVVAGTINPQIVPKPVASPSIICEDPPPPVRTLIGLVDKDECCAILIPNLKPRIG